MFSPAQIDQVRRLDEGSLTGVKSTSETTQRVHVGVDEGSFDTSPICGELVSRGTETTDAPANCPNCKRLMRLAGKNLSGLFENVPDDYDSSADRFSADYLDPRQAGW